MKYSFIMPYYKRPDHLHNTFLSYRHHYNNRKDYEVVIVEDGGNVENITDHEMLLSIIKEYPDIDVKHIQSVHKDQMNPGTLRNEAVRVSIGDILIQTNPECFHKTNILAELDKEDLVNKYIVCACENIFFDAGRATAFEQLLIYRHSMWYQHTKFNNRVLHWCSSISRINFDRIGGFDEEYSKYCDLDDDDFRETIKKNGIPIVCRDDLHVCHIEHIRSNNQRKEKVELAKKYYCKKWGKTL